MLCVGTAKTSFTKADRKKEYRMKNDNSKDIVYEISVRDLQDVSREILERPLTKKEVALVSESVGDYIDWFQAIEHAIHAHVDG
jgi:hypothetical protein